MMHLCSGFLWALAMGYHLGMSRRYPHCLCMSRRSPHVAQRTRHREAAVQSATGSALPRACSLPSALPTSPPQPPTKYQPASTTAKKNRRPCPRRRDRKPPPAKIRDLHLAALPFPPTWQRQSLLLLPPCRPSAVRSLPLLSVQQPARLLLPCARRRRRRHIRVASARSSTAARGRPARLLPGRTARGPAGTRRRAIARGGGQGRRQGGAGPGDHESCPVARVGQAPCRRGRQVRVRPRARPDSLPPCAAVGEAEQGKAGDEAAPYGADGRGWVQGRAAGDGEHCESERVGDGGSLVEGEVEGLGR